MQFSSERLHYRLLEEQDRETFIALYQDPKVMRKVGNPLDRDEISKMFSHALKMNSHCELRQMIWAIHQQSDNQFCGILMFKRFERSSDFELGIMLLPSSNGKKLGVEAVGQLIIEAEKQFEVNNFLAFFDETHLPVKRILLELNFSFKKVESGSNAGQVRATKIATKRSSSHA